MIEMAAVFALAIAFLAFRSVFRRAYPARPVYRGRR